MKNDEPLRVGIQQRVLPAYRGEFFDLLAEAYQGNVCVYSGQPRPDEALGELANLKTAQQYPAENLHLGHGSTYLCSQRNIIRWLKFWDPHVLIMEANPRYLKSNLAITWMQHRKRPVIARLDFR